MDEQISFLSKIGESIYNGERTLGETICLDVPVEVYLELLDIAAKTDNFYFLSGLSASLNDFIMFKFDALTPEIVKIIWDNFTLILPKINNLPTIFSFSLAVSHFALKCRLHEYPTLGENFRNLLYTKSISPIVMSFLIRGIYQIIQSSYIETNMHYYLEVISSGLALENFQPLQIDMLKFLNFCNFPSDLLLSNAAFYENFWKVLLSLTHYTTSDGFRAFRSILPVIYELHKNQLKFFNISNSIIGSFIESQFQSSVSLYDRIFSSIQLIFLSPFQNDDILLHILELFSMTFMEYFDRVGPLTEDLHQLLIDIHINVQFNKDQTRKIFQYLKSSFESKSPFIFFLFSVLDVNVDSLTNIIFPTFLQHFRKMNQNLVATCTYFLFDFIDAYQEYHEGIMNVIRFTASAHVRNYSFLIFEAYYQKLCSYNDALYIMLSSYCNYNSDLIKSESSQMEENHNGIEEFYSEIQSNIYGSNECYNIFRILKIIDKRKSYKTVENVFKEIIFPFITETLNMNQLHPEFKLSILQLIDQILDYFCDIDIIDKFFGDTIKIGMQILQSLFDLKNQHYLPILLKYASDIISFYPHIQSNVLSLVWNIYSTSFSIFMENQFSKFDANSIYQEFPIIWKRFNKHSSSEIDLNESDKQIYNPFNTYELLLEKGKIEDDICYHSPFYQAFYIAKSLSRYEAIPIFLDLLKHNPNRPILFQMMKWLTEIMEEKKILAENSNLLIDIGNFIHDIVVGNIFYLGGSLPVFHPNFIIDFSSLLSIYLKISPSNSLQLDLLSETVFSMLYAIKNDDFRALDSVSDLCITIVKNKYIKDEKSQICLNVSTLMLNSFSSSDIYLTSNFGKILYYLDKNYSFQTFPVKSILCNLKECYNYPMDYGKNQASKKILKLREIFPIILKFLCKYPENITSFQMIFKDVSNQLSHDITIFGNKIHSVIENIYTLFKICAQLSHQDETMTILQKITISLLFIIIEIIKLPMQNEETEKAEEELENEISVAKIVGKALIIDGIQLLGSFFLENPQIWGNIVDSLSVDSKAVQILVQSFPSLPI